MGPVWSLEEVFHCSVKERGKRDEDMMDRWRRELKMCVGLRWGRGWRVAERERQRERDIERGERERTDVAVWIKT